MLGKMKTNKIKSNLANTSKHKQNVALSLYLLLFRDILFVCGISVQIQHGIDISIWYITDFIHIQFNIFCLNFMVHFKTNIIHSYLINVFIIR